jgi:hypothetical protein
MEDEPRAAKRKPNEPREYYSPYKMFRGSIVPNWIMKRNDISQGAKLCFGRLAQFAGQDEYAFPGLETLAGELAVSESSVKAYIRELVTLGVIEWRRMGSGKFSLYYFTITDAVEFRTDRQKTIRQKRSDRQNFNLQRASDRQKTIRSVGHNSISPNREENHEESTEENQKESVQLRESEDDDIPW